MGLSFRECAKLLGVPHQTLASAEQGGDCGIGLFELAAHRLEGFRAVDLLGLREPDVPAASRAAWEQYTASAGMVASRAIVRTQALAKGLNRICIDVRGARALGTHADKVQIRRMLTEITCVGPASLVRRIRDWKGARFELNEKGLRRVWSASGRDASRIDLRATGMTSESPGAWEGNIPVEELVLSLHVSARQASKVRLLAWPFSAPTDPAWEIARQLHPIGVAMERRGGRVEVRIPFPLPQVRYALAIVNEAHVGAGPRLDTVGERVAARRAELKLGLGAVADKSGLAPMACRFIEKREREGRISTIRTLGLTLGMSAAEMLDDIASDEDTLAEPYYRRVFGIVASSVEKRLVIFEDGTAQSTIETRRLRALRGGSALQVRVGVVRAVLQRTPDVLEAIEAELEDSKVRRIRHEAGGCEHELRFPARGARNGVSYIRRFARKPQFSMSLKEVARRFDTERHAAGVGLACTHPTDTLRLELRFPRGFEPARVRGHCFPPGQLPRHALPSLAANPSPRVSISNTSTGLVAVLRVQSPLPGFQYAMSWTL